MLAFFSGVFVELDTSVLAFGSRRQMTKLWAWGFALCVAIASWVVPAVAQQNAQPSPQKLQHTAEPEKYPELPAGAGRSTLIRVCSKCHSPVQVMASGQDQQGWENTISKMATFGAVGTDDDFNVILDYLVANFPPSAGVKINEATAAQLELGLELSTADADAIIQYRKKNGAFKSIDDLNKVPGVNVKKLDAEQARLIF